MKEPEVVDKCARVLRGYFDAVDVGVASPARPAPPALPARPGQPQQSRRGTLPRALDREIKLRRDGAAWTLAFEAKARLSPVVAEHLITQWRAQAIQLPETLLFADYVSPNVAETLRLGEVNFVDAVGNVFLELSRPPVLVDVQGRRPRTDERHKTSRLFSPTGMQLLFLLLTQPDRTGCPYRALSDLSGVSLGSVGWIMAELRNEGYLSSVRDDGPALLDRPALFERWIEAYPRQLRRKMLIAELTAPEADAPTICRDLARVMSKHKKRWALSGEAAADILTHHLATRAATVFAEEWSEDYERELRWVPSGPGGTGNVTVFRLFAPCVIEEDLAQECPLSHPALIYAELLAKRGERERETAHMLAKRYLADLVVQR